MREMLMYPVFGLLFLSFASQLIDIAESTSDKTLDYADDMKNAVDCAIKGIDLSICSPGLLDYNYDGEINKTVEISNEMIDALTKEAEEKGLEISIE